MLLSLPPSGRWGWVFRRRTSLPCPWTDNLRTWDCGCRRPWPLWWGQPWCGRRECSSSPWTDSQHKSKKQNGKLKSINSHICLLLLTSKNDTILLSYTKALRVLMQVSSFRKKGNYESMLHKKYLFIFCRNVFLSVLGMKHSLEGWLIKSQREVLNLFPMSKCLHQIKSNKFYAHNYWPFPAPYLHHFVEHFAVLLVDQTVVEDSVDLVDPQTDNLLAVLSAPLRHHPRLQ